MNVYIYKDNGYVPYVPTSNTLFYVTNNWEISDHSQYNHTMNWYWTGQYTTLSTWQKVAKFDWSNLIHSNSFNEANSYTTFTMHWRVKKTSTVTSDTSPFWWMWRNQNSSSTTDRWWAKWQTEPWATTNWYIIYWWWTSDWIKNTSVWFIPSTSSFDLMTVTINWKTISIYKNATQVWSWTWSVNILWWSTTWTTIFAWWAWTYNWTAAAFQPFEMWEFILEKRVWTANEIANYYNNTKSLYWIS